MNLHNKIRALAFSIVLLFSSAISLAIPVHAEDTGFSLQFDPTPVLVGENSKVSLSVTGTISWSGNSASDFKSVIKKKIEASLNPTAETANITIKWYDLDGVKMIDMWSVQYHPTSNWITDIDIPDDIKAGTYKVTVTNATGGPLTTVEGYLTIQTVDQLIANGLSFTDGTVAPGEELEIKGKNFKGLSNNQKVSLYLGTDGTIKIADITPNADGTFTHKYTVPSLTTGTYTIKAVYGNGSTTKTFEVEPKLTFATSAAFGGEKIAVSGVGFEASKEISFFINDNPSNPTMLGTLNTDENGAFSGEITVPQMAANTYVVTIKCGSKTLTHQVQIKFQASMSITKGYAGDIIELSGSGFTPDKVLYILQKVDGKYDHQLDLPAMKTDEFGNIPEGTTITVPEIVAGIYELRITDTRTENPRHKADITFEVLAKVEFQTKSDNDHRLNVNDTVVFSGSGFTPNANATVILRDALADKASPTDLRTDVKLADFKIDSHGLFAVSFKLPATVNSVPLTGGDKVLIVSDLDANGNPVHTGKELIYLDNTAPPVPALTAPADQQVLYQPLSFTWSPVTDPSGVKYEFQFGADITFSNVLITGVFENPSVQFTSSTVVVFQGQSYTADNLPILTNNGSYYWRVRSFDSYGNYSAWSTAYSITMDKHGITTPPTQTDPTNPATNTTVPGTIISKMPKWLWFVIGGLGVVVIVLLGIIVGRKMAYRSF